MKKLVSTFIIMLLMVFLVVCDVVYTNVIESSTTASEAETKVRFDEFVVSKYGVEQVCLIVEEYYINKYSEGYTFLKLNVKKCRIFI